MLGEGGTWEGSSDLVATIDPALTPVQQNVAVLPSEQLVLMSDSPAPVSSTASIVRGDASGLAVQALTSVAGSPVTAELWASDFACEDLAMSSADEEDQRVASSLVEKAGGVSPLSGLVIAQQPDRSITVGMLFETSDQASENLQPRVDLAAGDAPGQGGTFPDRFRVTSRRGGRRTRRTPARAHRRAVRLQRHHERPRPLRHLLTLGRAPRGSRDKPRRAR